ncbi:hypothetical protein FF011L_08610 [Roseimaritima multifibrata]|uniref:Squalene cyclase C-terminal domain-containing protein n=1 Tax=Roseimaritima multifibrata TaxID=1930274 RepID=A0A517MB66_9BACT|nr:prenyltransferase/squalene oxidase repeat-containing protein [Roseimaritima multifibrata]QDS92125.1 hypothetical protein FF011L_08610 [Roseimaritima multifibrata]
MTNPARPPIEVPPVASRVPPVLVAAPPVAPPPEPSEAANWHLPGSDLLPTMKDERVPAWLVSMILHTIALLVLALLTVPPHGGGGLLLQVDSAESSQTNDASLQALIPPTPQTTDEALAAEQPIEVPLAVPSVAAQTPASPLEPKASSAPDPKAMTAALMASMTSGQTTQMPSGGGLGGRSATGRKVWGDKFGATPESEEAVELGLKWLAAHQRSDGSWSFDLSNAPCNGECSNPRRNPDNLPTPPTAATGLALLAFMGAGYTNRSGPYQEEIDRGLYYLRGQMRPAEFGSDLQMGSMYGHGIASLAIAEAASMTEDSGLVLMSDELTRFILAARHPTSSWGYFPGAPGDVTLTGWQLMALKGAQRLKISMPSDTFSRIGEYLDSMSLDDGIHYGYREPGNVRTPTAIALASQLYLGRSPTHPGELSGLNQLIEWGPSKKSVYYNYYATLALHHARHPSWDKWHPLVRDYLVQTQAKKGHERGSWHFKDHYGDVGGRLYTTAMAIMTLEVYYRYLPLYDDPNEFPL